MAISLRLATRSLRMGRGFSEGCARGAAAARRRPARGRFVRWTAKGRRYFGQEQRHCKAGRRAESSPSPTINPMDNEFRQLVLDAAGRADVREAVGRVYADL